MESKLLSLAVFLPAIAAVGLIYVPRNRPAAIRWVTLLATLVTLGLCLLVWRGFDPGLSGFQAELEFEWIPSLGVGFRVGLDGISLFLVLLTALILPIAVLASWGGVTERVREFHIALLCLETGMIGVFAATDLALFYVFWEVMLIPMVLLIGIWGSSRRIYAAVKFFVYTMVGSLLMFLAILYLYFHLSRHGVSSFALEEIYAGLQANPLSTVEQVVLFAAFALSFAIKVPLFPLHTWLPDAHTEAPTAGSVVLAAVLLKMGTYGFLRYAMPFFPEAVALATPLICTLAVVSIVFGALMCLAQEDFKRLIAYSSVSHLGFVMLGIFALNLRGVTGGIFQMLSHGISTGALFLLIGAIYERTHTRRIADYGGYARAVPRYAAIFFFVLLSSIGLPALNGFVGEFLILLGSFESRRWFAVIAASGMVLGALYMLILYQRVFYGPLNPGDGEADGNDHGGGHGSAHAAGVSDLNLRELVYLAPLLLLMIGMGMGSPWFTAYIEPTVAGWLERFGFAAGL